MRGARPGRASDKPVRKTVPAKSFDLAHELNKCIEENNMPRFRWLTASFVPMEDKADWFDKAQGAGMKFVTQRPVMKKPDLEAIYRGIL